MDEADIKNKKLEFVKILYKIVEAIENDHVIACNVSVYNFAKFGVGLNKLAEIMYTGKNRYIIDITLDEGEKVDHEKLRKR